MTVQARLSDTSIVVAPGGEETVRLSVRNLGSDVETFAITPSGFCAGWTTAEPASLALLPGEEQIVSITLRPPRAAMVSSGDSVLALRVMPHGRPADVAVVEATVRVLAFASRRLVVAQPVQIGSRRAEYDVVLENNGNERANCRLTLVDLSGRLIGRFDPPSLGVDPGQSSATRLRLRPRRRTWFGAARSTRFSIEAEQGGSTAALAEATFVQSPMFSSRLVSTAGGLVAAAALVVGAWTFVVRPTIDDAATDAVAEATTPSASTTVPDDGSTAPLPTTATGIVNTLVSVTADTGGSAEGRLTASDGDLEISDVVVQNPGEDQGTLTIATNGDVLFTFDLESVYGYEQVALSTPIVVAAGGDLVVSVECDAPGDPAAPACTPSVFVSGRTR